MRSSDRGQTTAETAVVLPALALFALVLIWGLTAAAAQIRCVDAARAGARAAARQESPAATLAAARSAAPGGARIAVNREGDLVRVRVEAPAPGPGPLGVSLRAEAVALSEAAAADPPGSEAGPATGVEEPPADGGADRGRHPTAPERRDE